MTRRRFFVDRVHDGRAALLGEDAQHLRRTLRAEIGQLYELSDNCSVYLAEIESIGKDRVEFRTVETVAALPPPVRVTLLLALIKFDRFEWALEKATELGAVAIVPIVAERSEKGLEKASLSRLERWRKIVRESSQQARRAQLPAVQPPAPLNAALADSGHNAYFLDEEPGGCPLLAALPEQRRPEDEVRALIGPEGGWTDRERACAHDAGWKPVTLGPNILRTETAAIAALATLFAAWQTGP